MFWTEGSIARNRLTMRYEPIQPFLFCALVDSLQQPTVLDVGANVGFYSILVAAGGLSADVHAFEPDEQAHGELKNNIRLNRLHDLISAHDHVVSDCERDVDFGVHQEMSGINAVISTTFHDKAKYASTRTVPAVPLDAMNAGGTSSVAVKIDVEGHEQHVLRGARNILRREAVVQVESYGDSSELEAYLRSLGFYKIFALENDLYFSNIPVLREAEARVALLEKAAQLLIGFAKDQWPPQNEAIPPATVSAHRAEDKVLVSVEIDESFFEAPAEYAYYLTGNSGPVQKIWYRENPTAQFDVSQVPGPTQLRVKAFVREKNNPSFKIMKEAKVR